MRATLKRKLLEALTALVLLCPWLAMASDLTPWMKEQSFKEYINARTDDLYPVMIEARPVLGDSVEFRALLVGKPSDDFVYHTIYGASDSGFSEAMEKHKKAGFVLIQHQEETLLHGKVHQAVWVAAGH